MAVLVATTHSSIFFHTKEFVASKPAPICTKCTVKKKRVAGYDKYPKSAGTFRIYSPNLFHRKMKKKPPAAGSHQGFQE